ncbi:MAG: glycoside hydrolase family 127 protein, partial [Bacteroidales bacterium]|nr:glycoside hydrolase family 127 protein [Bacteroidales bacterium]
ADTFAAKIGDEHFTGTPGKFLKIKRTWTKGDQINVTIGFPVIVLEGGKSYPDHYAVKYGPQVLAVDGKLNRIADLETVFFEVKSETIVKSYKGKLPAEWIGEQAYISNSVKTVDGKKVILVPFSDASQTGGDIRVWIKAK